MTSQATERQNQETEREQKERLAREQHSGFPSIAGLYAGMSPSAAPAGSALETQIAWQAYFDLADQSVRTSRRVSESLFVNSLRQQIIDEVKEQVVRDLRAGSNR